MAKSTAPATRIVEDTPQGIPPRVRRYSKRQVSPEPDTRTPGFERAREGNKIQRAQDPDTDQNMETNHHVSWWRQVEEQYKKTTTQGECFWSEDTASVEIEISLPETKRGMRAERLLTLPTM